MDICQCLIFLILIFTSAGVVAYFLKYFYYEYLIPVLIFTSAGVVAWFLKYFNHQYLPVRPVRGFTRLRLSNNNNTHDAWGVGLVLILKKVFCGTP